MKVIKYLCVLLIAAAAFGKEVPHDEKLERALAKGYKVTKENNGIFSIVVELPNLKRSQRVFVNSEILDVEGYRYREIWAIALQGQETTKPDVYAFLLRDTADKYLGGWKLMSVGKQETAVFFVCVPEKATGREIGIALAVVAATADLAEKKFLGSDEY